MARILVVDDEESIRFTFRSFLSAQGHVVDTAENFSQAVAAMQSNAPDLVFVDLILDDRPGSGLLQYIQERGLNCQVIVITGEPSGETSAETLQLGAFGYAPKPLDRDTLLAFTRHALLHKELADEKQALAQEKEVLRLRLEAIFRSLPDSVLTVDRSMRVIQANPPLEDLAGVSVWDMLGKPCSEVFGQCGEVLCKVVAETLRTSSPVKEYRVETTCGDGGKRTLVVNCTPLMDNGDHQGAVLIVRDISRQVGMERELKERRRFRKIIGKSPRMQEIYDLLEDLSSTTTTVLVTGPSGTGKELVAEALHFGGDRASKPMVKVNCSALSENLLESELFGHVRGAFTGAVRDKVGRFKLAHGGSIFLDEIGDISPRIQLKLLRVLQEKEFEPVGENSTVKVDVRVMAATNQDLRQKVREGEFREDLYYRLKVVEILLPALKERREDIPLLLDHFVEYYNKQMNKNVSEVSDEVRSLFMDYAWPGNIRELRHAVEHAFILSRGNAIDVEHLPLEIRQQAAVPLMYQRDRLGREDLSEALRIAGGNKAKAARMLGISRQTIYRKLREHSLP